MRKKKRIDTIKKNTGSSELDIRLKDFWRDNTHFADLVNATVFSGEEVIQPGMLIEADTDFSGFISFPEYDETLKRSHDIVKKCSLGMEFIILAVEDQNRVHYAMPLRTMIYDAMGYLKEYQELTRLRKQQRSQKAGNKSTTGTRDEFLSGIRKSDRLHAQISIVLYCGDHPWDGPLSLRDMMTELPSPASAAFCNYEMNLIQILDSGNYIFHNKDVQTLFEGSAALMRGDFDFIYQNFRQGIPSELATIIALITGSELLRQQTEKEATVDMCKALEDFERNAAEKGAWEKVISQVAIKLRKGKSPEQIADELEESLPVIEKAILELQQGQITANA